MAQRCAAGLGVEIGMGMEDFGVHHAY